MALRFRHLQALHAIVETGTVTAAAHALGVSQPAVSNLVTQMERIVRMPLFDRVRGRLLPTPETMLLYQEIDTVLRGVAHVNQTVIDLQNSQVGQLQAASSHALSFGFMPEVIARFCKGRPNLSVSFQSQYSGKIQDWVKSGLFEIGVCELPLMSDGFEAELFRYRTVCVLPESHPLAQHDILTPDLLEDVPFIVMGPDHMTHRRTREAFESAGRRWRPQVHTHLFRNVLSFVRQGMGVALMDPFTVHYAREGGFETRPFTPSISLDVAIVTAQGRPLSQIGRAFREVLRTEMRAFEQV